METNSEIIQLFGIGVGAVVAMITLVVGTLVWSINIRDRANAREHQETRRWMDERHRETMETMARLRGETHESIERLRQETLRLFERFTEENARQHRELAGQFAPLYRHVHDDGGRAIIPADELDPTATPAPADN